MGMACCRYRKKRNMCRTLVVKLNKIFHLKDLGADGMVILKISYTNSMGWRRLDSSGLG
jgi:hypothetical protein